jgi:hypothetical protein
MERKIKCKHLPIFGQFNIRQQVVILTAVGTCGVQEDYGKSSPSLLIINPGGDSITPVEVHIVAGDERWVTINKRVFRHNVRDRFLTEYAWGPVIFSYDFHQAL